MRTTPDYNLGRAHGEVIITADTRDATRGMGEYERATRSASAAASDQSRIEQELTRRRQEAEQAIRRRKDAEADYTRIARDSTASTEQQIAAEIRRSQARDDAERSTRRLVEAERAFQSAVRGNNDEVQKFLRTLGDFGDGVDRHSRRMRDFRTEITQTSLASKALGDSLSATVGAMAKMVGILGAGGAAGGVLGLLGAGGIQGVLAATEAIKDFSGALLLLPAGIGGAVTILGTLAVALNGVGDALGAMDDPEKFTQAIQKLAPAAAQAVTIIASFRDAIKGAMAAVQQSLFQPLVDQIEPLIRTWLPALMQAGQQVANVLGEAGRAVAQWLQQPAQMQAFQQFIGNLVNGLNAMLPAIQPVLNAFTQLAVVGSTFFPQIAEIIVRIATAFNNWVQGAAASGDLQRWIQTAIDSFEQLFQAIGNILHAAQDIGRAFDAAGSKGFLQWLVDVTQAFREWTSSVEGAQLLTTFFQNLHQASQILGPVLRTVGVAILQLLNNLVQLGIQMGPGIQSFFNSLAEALNQLGQSLVASGPALGQILTTLGQTLVQIIQQVGPQLPELFANLAQALVQIAPAAVAVAAALAGVMANLSPETIVVIIGIVAAFQAISTIVPIIQALSAAITFLAANPIVLLVAAVAAAAVLIVTHWEDVKAAVQAMWDKIQEFVSWLGSAFANAWQSVANSVTEIWNSITNAFGSWLSQAYEWGKNLVGNIVSGIRDYIGEIANAAGDIGQTIHDFLFTSSPAKKGPLHDTSPNQMGENIASNFSAGIESGDVSGAASGLAGGVTTGMGFSSAGMSGKSGKGTSGFDQWIDSLTQDLRSWSDFAQKGFELFKSVADVMIQTAKVTASLWNGGDNPMTQPGGIFGKAPGLTPEQQQIPGVQNMPQAHGTAPLPALVPKGPAGAPPVPQQSIPGVPAPPGGGQVGAPATPAPPAAPPPAPPGPGSAGTPPPASMPPPAPGTAGVPAGPSAVPNATAAANVGNISLARGASPDKVASEIITEGRRRGLSDAQIQAAGMIASDESNFGTPGFNSSGGNASVGGVGGTFQQSSQAGWGTPEQILDPRYSISKFYDIYQENLRRFPGIDPIDAAILTQNPQLVTQYGIEAGNLYEGSQYGRQTKEAWEGQRGGSNTYNRALLSVGPRPAGNVQGQSRANGAGTAAGQGIAGVPTGDPRKGTAVLGGALATVGAGVAATVAPFATAGVAAGTGGLLGAATAFGAATGGGDDVAWENWSTGKGPRPAGPIPPGITPPPGSGEVPNFGPRAPGAPPAPTQTQGSAAPTGSFTANPASQAGQFGGNQTTYSLGFVESHFKNRLYDPAQAQSGTPKGLPPEVIALAQQFGLKAVTRPEGGSLHEAGYATDIFGSPEQMDKLAAYIQDNLAQQTIQLIYKSQKTGQTYGIAGGQAAGPGTNAPGYYAANWAGHMDHIHWATDVVPTTGPQVALQGSQGRAGAFAGAGLAPAAAPTLPKPPATTPQPPAGPGSAGSTAGDWMRVPPGWDITQPIPMDVRAQHGIPPDAPPMYYSAQPGTVTNVIPPAGYTGPVSPGGTISTPLPGGAQGQPGFPSTQQNLPFGAATPMDAFASGMQAASSMVGDAFKIFNDVITNIKAGADMFDMAVRGFENTEDVNKFIDNFQTFIQTGADIAKMVGDVGGIVSMAGGATGGTDFGGTAAAGAAVQAVAGIVQGALEATNMAIDLGQMAWQQITKYAVGIFAGGMLGGADTGPLSGNVRMLLNTNTGQLQAYSEDNPLNKQTHNLPQWLSRSYGGPNPNAQPNVQQNQLNLYIGPGADASSLISDTMWLANTGAPSVASVAGAE